MDNEKKLADLFKAAQNQTPQTSFDEVKNRFLESIDNLDQSDIKSTKKVFTIKKGLIMLSIIMTIGLSLLIISKPKTTIEQRIAKEVKTKAKNTTNEKLFPHNLKESGELDNRIFQQNFETYLAQTSLENVLLKNRSSMENRNFLFQPIPIDSSKKKQEIVIPILTANQIKSNMKQKELMLKDLMKFENGKHYSYIPSGAFDYLGTKISLQSFVISQTEVSNLEYKTFLNDLLIQGRTDEFIDAYPDEGLWFRMFGKYTPPEGALYFKHPAYNNYPVCNVSLKQAEMYCAWLEEEFFINYKLDTDNKDLRYHIRIPTREEWCYAASSCGKYNVYPWGTDSTKNSDGKYEVNYKPFPKKFFDDGAFTQAITTAYNKSPFGLYCMSGNVAEYVYESIYKTNPGTAGGGWMDDAETIKIFGPDPYKGMISGHPNIGFRVMFTKIGHYKLKKI